MNKFNIRNYFKHILTKKRAYHFIKRERINLEKYLKEEDRVGTGNLTFDKFKRILDSKGIIFRETEFTLIKIKFDLEFNK